MQTLYYCYRPIATILMILAPCVAASQEVMYGAERCGVLRSAGQYGPFDYRSATASQKGIVENAHFGPLSEALVKAMITRNAFAADFDYTLRAFPNHPRALIAMSRISLRERKDKPYGARWSVDCYFARGMAFQPNDHLVPLIYANYLRQTNRPQEAKAHLRKAERITGEEANSLTLTNIGLQYVELGDLGEAERLADLVAELDPTDKRLRTSIAEQADGKIPR